MRATGVVQIQVTIKWIIDGYQMLNDASLQASKQWCFKHTEISGRAVMAQGFIIFAYADNGDYISSIEPLWLKCP
jgi:hypothetical protein